MSNTNTEITSILGKAKWLLGLGVLVILVMPFLLTFEFFHERFNFSETGQIGDTIGGITAPFLNLIGAFLVFYALKAQTKANELIQNQIDKDNLSKENETEVTNLNQLYSYLLESVNSFKFKSLPEEDLRNKEYITTDIEYEGGEAFYQMFNQIRCHYHGSQHELETNQSISELISILKVIDLLLKKLEKSKCSNKEILETLTEHIFEYKIITRVRDESMESLKIWHCDECNCNHGIPDNLRELIISIRKQMNNGIEQ